MSATARAEPFSPRTILAVDWSGTPDKRAVWRADVEGRAVGLVEGGPWSLARVLEAARALPGPVLIGIDAALGLPRPYVERVRIERPKVRTFLDWLKQTDAQTFEPVTEPEDWATGRPFFRVAPGPGGRARFCAAAGSDLLRNVDRRLGGNPAFIVSGIPGSVGSGTSALWRELAPLLGRRRDFALWPFDGRVDALGARAIVLAEVYPRAMYGVALGESLPAPRLNIAKTKGLTRAQAVPALAEADWIEAEGVRFEGLAEASASEDHFDAAFTAAGLLRAVLEGAHLEGEIEDPTVEGGILGEGALQPGRARNWP